MDKNSIKLIKLYLNVNIGYLKLNELALIISKKLLSSILIILSKISNCFYSRMINYIF